MNTTQDSRYPYTYAADYIRGVAGYGENGTKISRGDASAIRLNIAQILNLNDEQVAKNLADHYLANREDIDAKGAASYFAMIAARKDQP